MIEALKTYVRNTFPHLLTLLAEKQYEQIDWIDTSNESNERLSTLSTNEYKIHHQQQRIFARLHFLFLLKLGDKSAYHQFTNGQKEPRLTFEHFIELSSFVKKLSDAEYQQLWVATLTFRSPEAITRAKKALGEEPPFDGVEFLAKVMIKAPEIYPGVDELMQRDQTAQKGFATLFDTGHFRHMMYVEGGFNMFDKLLVKIQKNEFKQKELDLWFTYWLIDVTGFRAQTNQLGSDYLNDNTYKAVITLKSHLDQLLINIQYPILKQYLMDRAKWLNVIENIETIETSELVLGRIAAMQRLFTPEEKTGLKNGLLRLEEKLGKENFDTLISTLNPLQKNSEPTPTYGPLLLANLRAESNFEEAIFIGLPIYAKVLELYRQLRSDNKIDQSMPLSLNGLASADNIQALIKGCDFLISIVPENGTTALKTIKKENNIAFFVSSAGDTDLAKSTITALLEQNVAQSIFLIPLTATAEKRTEDMIGKHHVNRLSLKTILNQTEVISPHSLTDKQLETIQTFINVNHIQRAYIGVPSPIDEKIPYQIANFLNIPCTIAYEFMFKPKNHPFWQYANQLASKGHKFAVPLKSAKQDILENASQVTVNKIDEIGHISLDRSLMNKTIDAISIKQSLMINENEELIFISATTQPVQFDNEFLEALLQELNTKKYPQLQLRFGVRADIKELDNYLKILLETCNKFPQTKNYFKFIITDEIKKQLKVTLPSDHPFILYANVSGPDAAHVAKGVGQAFPGALTNESATKGKPTYFHDRTTSPYLPETWFAKSIPTFFTAKPQAPHALKELDLSDSAPNLCAKLLLK